MFDNRMVTVDDKSEMLFSVEYKLSDSTIVGTECKWDQILLPNDIYENCNTHENARCIYTIRPHLANTNEYITRRRAREFFSWLNGMASNFPAQIPSPPAQPTPAPSTNSDESAYESADDSGVGTLETIIESNEESDSETEN